MDDESASKRRTKVSAALPNAANVSVARRVRLEEFELFILSGPDRGAHLPLRGPMSTIGYGSANQVRLSDESVSDRHVSLEETETGILLKDLGSTNGTKVDVVPVKEAYLKPGCDITLGDTVVRFQPRRERRAAD